MDEYITPIIALIDLYRTHLPIILGIIAVLFVIHFCNALVGYRLSHLGIYPRRWSGLVGVIFAPLLHADFNHIFFNAIPLFLLGGLVLLKGVTIFVVITLIIAFIAGVFTWIFGHSAYHIGSSSVIFGYWGYLLASAYSQETFVSVILAAVCIYYFSGFFFQIFPVSKGMSWEGHLFGAAGGVIAAFSLPYLMI